MHIAIVGTGIAGLTAAHRLFKLKHPRVSFTIFEASTYPGGHTHTHAIDHAGERFDIDTGFIVFNDRTYPGFVQLLDQLHIASRPTTMSFSVRHDALDLEYNGASLSHLFSQRRNLLRPGFYRMLRDIVRVAKDARQPQPTSQTIEDFVRSHGYSREFVDWYLVPMTSAIWSAADTAALKLPFEFFRSFFDNHGFFDLGDRPTWRTVAGGSKSYVTAILEPFRDRLRLSCPVHSIRRHPTHVELTSSAGTESFDAVLLATHSDTALAMLTDPSEAESKILGSLPYERNEAILHTDQRLLPKRRKVWAAWNAHLAATPNLRASVTYNMNMLQGHAPADDTQFLVTLNQSAAIDPSKVLRTVVYHHPIYSIDGFNAQKRHHEISGHRRTFYAGAYWRYGFHEDGHWSAVRAVDQIERTIAAS